MSYLILSWRFWLSQLLESFAHGVGWTPQRRHCILLRPPFRKSRTCHTCRGASKACGHSEWRCCFSDQRYRHLGSCLGPHCAHKTNTTTNNPPISRPSFTSSFQQTPWSFNTGGFEDTSEHRKQVDDALKQELLQAFESMFQTSSTRSSDMSHDSTNWQRLF
jgi:hypothetical protein